MEVIRRALVLCLVLIAGTAIEQGHYVGPITYPLYRSIDFFISCPVCCESFTLISHCQKHVQQFHNKSSRRCHICQETFGSDRILRVHRIRSHRQIVSSEKVLTCYICPRFFKHKNSVYKHIVLNHRGSLNHTLAACPTCPQVSHVVWRLCKGMCCFVIFSFVSILSALLSLGIQWW